MNLQRRVLLMGAFSLPLVPLASRMFSVSDSTHLHRAVLVREVAVPESMRFAQSWHSTNVIDFDGDIGSLLYERIVPMWRQHGVTTTAGLTNASALFCLAQVGADFGLRAIYRGIHRRLDGVVQHETQGMPLIAGPYATDWASQVACAVEGSMCAASPQRALPARELLPDGDSLVSWLMVPRALLAA